MWARAAWAATLFLALVHGEHAYGAISKVSQTESASVLFSERSAGIMKLNYNLDGFVLLHNGIKIILAQSFSRKHSSPFNGSRRQIQMRRGVGYRSAWLEFILSNFNKHIEANMIRNCMTEVSIREVPDNLSICGRETRRSCYNRISNINLENERSLLFFKNIKLALECFGCSCGFNPSETRKNGQNQSANRDSPVWRIGTMQTEFSGDQTRGPTYPPRWFVVFVPLGVIPWLAGIESIRQAHGAADRRAGWRNGVWGCGLIILALLTETLPLLLTYWLGPIL